MSKELTEKWLNGTLKKGNYYVNARNFYNGDLYKEEIDYFDGVAHWFAFAGVDEVLAPVPSYDEYKELKEDNKYLKSGIETRDKQIERLQEQLNDANDIIDFYFPKIKKIYSICIEPLKLYRKKWGVK